MRLRLFVLGASGRTGVEILRLGLARGHQVTAYVRSPGKLELRARDLSVVQGDALCSDELARALPGHDAVISAIGPSVREAFAAKMLLSRCADSLVAAMHAARLERLAAISSALLFAKTPLWFAPLRLVRPHMRDLIAMEAAIRASSLDWTLARPSRLIPCARERYRSAVDALPPHGHVIAYRAVAAFSLDAIERGANSREVVGLAG
jgi:putative NADH-flavin reductase